MNKHHTNGCSTHGACFGRRTTYRSHARSPRIAVDTSSNCGLAVLLMRFTGLRLDEVYALLSRDVVLDGGGNVSVAVRGKAGARPDKHDQGSLPSVPAWLARQLILATRGCSGPDDTLLARRPGQPMHPAVFHCAFLHTQEATPPESLDPLRNSFIHDAAQTAMRQSSASTVCRRHMPPNAGACCL